MSDVSAPVLTERIRTKVSETAKGLMQVEATFEDEAQSVAIDEAARRTVEAITALKAQLRQNGYKLAGD